ncbi:MAG: hypothetical protein IJ509_03660 [Bacilli bacterium]|nr:hypothetical protein [Bacilli bacterium]
MKKDNWIPIIFILTFILSFIFGSISTLVSNMNVLLLAILLIVIIGIGIIFDMIGVAVLSCEEATFHAKASRKIKGSKECVKLIKQANRTSSICNDVIGDICGIVSGSISASLVVLLLDTPIMSILLTAVVSALTVGGKAIGKRIAIDHAEDITFMVGKLLSKFNFKKKNK